MKTTNLLRKYNRLEDNNDHNEAAALLVNNFGTDDEKQTMKEIIARAEKQNGMTSEDIKLRYEISQKYYPIITGKAYPIQKK